MSTTEATELTDVLNRVKTWPVARRIALVKQVMETLTPATSGRSSVPRGPSAAEIIEAFKSDRPPPDDETVRKWIDEYRMEKYG
jgi:hypothetical protein